MKLFNIYVQKAEDDTIKDLVLVKSGFSLWAFIFNILWFLQHKMWRESIGILLVNILFFTIINKISFGGSSSSILEFGLILIVALNANYWYEQHLKNHHYQFLGCVFGKNRDEAKLRFVENFFNQSESNNKFCSSIFNLKKTTKTTQYFTI